MLLSRLNEISGGCEKIVPVSESFWSNLQFLRMIDLRALIYKNQTNSKFRGKSEKFDFFLILILDRLDYN